MLIASCFQQVFKLSSPPDISIRLIKKINQNGFGILEKEFTPQVFYFIIFIRNLDIRTNVEIKSIRNIDNETTTFGVGSISSYTMIAVNRYFGIRPCGIDMRFCEIEDYIAFLSTDCGI
jgi:hypothetical protein